MKSYLLALNTCLLAGAIVALAGCSGQASPQQAPAPTPVTVSLPIVRDFQDYEEFTGRTEAVDTVDVRAQVTGYLDKILFKEGDMVKKDQVLFQIDDRSFKAEFEQAKARIDVTEATFKFNDSEYRRNVSLRRTNAVSQEDVEKSLAQRDVSEASVKSAKADAAVKKINL